MFQNYLLFIIMLSTTLKLCREFFNNNSYMFRLIPVHQSHYMWCKTWKRREENNINIIIIVIGRWRFVYACIWWGFCYSRRRTDIHIVMELKSCRVGELGIRTNTVARSMTQAHTHWRTHTLVHRLNNNGNTALTDSQIHVVETLLPLAHSRNVHAHNKAPILLAVRACVCVREYLFCYFSFFFFFSHFSLL